MAGSIAAGAAAQSALERGWRERLRLASAREAVRARRATLGEVWLALWSSRLAAWLAGTYAVLAVGFRPTGGAPHTGAPLGNLGELLFGQAQRWDGGFYLSIAAHGYRSVPLAAFYPVYPAAIKAVGWVFGSLLISGIGVSILAFGAALYALHRLTALELGIEHARTAALALAFFPSALFFSAVYPTALLLALSIGAVYAARTGHWAWAGILGALASATHGTGALVAIPVVLLYLYGPRADRQPHDAHRRLDQAGHGPPRAASEPVAQARASRWLPRYRPRADILWIALVPAGLGAFLAYMGIAHGDVFRPLRANDMFWHRHFELLGGVTGIVGVLGHSFHAIATAQPDKLFPATNGPYRGAAVNVVDAATLLFGLVATVGALRRLPAAYGLYAMAALVVFASAPKPSEPLMSLPRLILVVFPLWMWLALWLDKRGRAGVWIACSGVAMGVASMQFATGRWVA